MRVFSDLEEILILFQVRRSTKNGSEATLATRMRKKLKFTQIWENVSRDSAKEQILKIFPKLQKCNIILSLCYLHIDQITEKELKPSVLGLEWPPRVAEKCLAPEGLKGAKSLFASNIVKKFGLAKTDRVYLENDFKYILKEGVKIYGDGCVLWHRPNPHLTAGGEQKPSGEKVKGRIGVIVSKKLGNAVVRNRCKRLFKEAFRLNRHLFTDGADCLVSVKNADKFPDLEAAGAAFLQMAKKAGIFKEP